MCFSGLLLSSFFFASLDPPGNVRLLLLIFLLLAFRTFDSIEMCPFLFLVRRDWVFVEAGPGGGGMGGGLDPVPIDCVRQMYMGHPRGGASVKMCTRCAGTTSHNPNAKAKSGLQGWDNRWLRHCHCGGLWKVSAHEE